MAATMKDLARETGLGLATISKYFNGGNVREKNRLLIDAAVKKLHYAPNEVARSLKTQHSRVIGVVIPELSNVFITSIISTMEDILRRQDYAVIVCDCRSDPKREKAAVDFLLDGDFRIARAYATIRPLQPGQSVTLKANTPLPDVSGTGVKTTWTAVPGTHDFMALLNTGNCFPPEQNEYNNRLCTEMEIGS